MSHPLYSILVPSALQLASEFVICRIEILLKFWLDSCFYLSVCCFPPPLLKSIFPDYESAKLLNLDREYMKCRGLSCIYAGFHPGQKLACNCVRQTSPNLALYVFILLQKWLFLPFMLEMKYFTNSSTHAWFVTPKLRKVVLSLTKTSAGDLRRRPHSLLLVVWKVHEWYTQSGKQDWVKNLKEISQIEKVISWHKALPARLWNEGSVCLLTMKPSPTPGIHLSWNDFSPCTWGFEFVFPAESTSPVEASYFLSQTASEPPIITTRLGLHLRQHPPCHLHNIQKCLKCSL